MIRETTFKLTREQHEKARRIAIVGHDVPRETTSVKFPFAYRVFSAKTPDVVKSGLAQAKAVGMDVVGTRDGMPEGAWTVVAFSLDDHEELLHLMGSTTGPEVDAFVTRFLDTRRAFAQQAGRAFELCRLRLWTSHIDALWMRALDGDRGEDLFWVTNHVNHHRFQQQSAYAFAEFEKIVQADAQAEHDAHDRPH